MSVTSVHDIRRDMFDGCFRWVSGRGTRFVSRMYQSKKLQIGVLM